MADDTSLAIAAPDDDEEKKFVAGPQPRAAYGPFPTAPVTNGGPSILPMPAPAIQHVAAAQAPPMEAPSITNPTPTAPAVAPSQGVNVAAGPSKPLNTDQQREATAQQGMSPIQQQNPFAVLMAKEEAIHNPFLRVLSKVATGIGAGAEGLSKDYPEIEKERAAEAAAPGEAAQRQAVTAHEQADTAAIPSETALRQAQAGHENAEAYALAHPKPKLLSGEENTATAPDGTKYSAYQMQDGSVQWFPEGQSPQTGVAPSGGVAGGSAAPAIQPAAGPAGPQVPAAGPQRVAPAPQAGTLPAGSVQGKPAEQQTKLTPSQVQQYNQQLAQRWEALNPNKQIPSAFTLQPDATIADYKAADESLKSDESIAGTQAQREATNQARQATQQTAEQSRNDARTDRSYQFNSTQLEKLRQPVDTEMQKINTALTNINLKTPQADALLAPEILSLTAGGQGSGLRMNEAEISRIVGGRTAWESLQAAVNKWSADPKHPAIPEAQRQQMMDIVQAAAQKGQIKQQALEWAESRLVAAEDVKEHRQILVDARQILDAIDQGKRVQRNKSTGDYRIAPNQ